MRALPPMRPNTSVEARPNGGPPGPVWRYAYIFASPGLASHRRPRLTSNVRRRKLYVARSIETTSTKAEGRHGSALVRRAWDQITKPSASTALHIQKSQWKPRILLWSIFFNIILPLRPYPLFVSQGRFAPPCSAPGSQLVACVPPSLRSARIQPRPSFALVLRNAQNLCRWAGRASAASVARKPIKSSSASSRAADCPKDRVAVVWPYRRLTRRSRRGPTASHQARAGGTLYIFTDPGLAACRRPRLTSNVRRRKLCVARAIAATSTKAEGRHGSALVRRAWDQITKPSASTTLHTRKSQVKATNFALAHII